MQISQKFQYWQDKFLTAKDNYTDALQNLTFYEEMYNGTRNIAKNANAKSEPKKRADVVRNIIYELVEAQIDSNIPAPKITAMRKKDVQNALECENKIRCEIDRLPMETVNDMAERFVYALGGCGYHIEWDNTKCTHDAVGQVRISVLHPKQIIPQPGVYDIQSMDYLFLLAAQTKEFIKKSYGIDIDGETEEYPEIRGRTATDAKDMVTQIICYYKNSAGGVGRFSWVGDTVLEDMEDFQARKIRVCKNCGRIEYGFACKCGAAEFIEKQEDGEILPKDMFLQKGETVLHIPAGTKIPYYKPDIFPVVVRKNVSKYGSLLGSSDIEVIKDHQDAIKKLQTKIMEKILKGGSFLTLGKDIKAKLDGEELNVLRLASPQDKSLIDVYNIQPQIANDIEYAEKLYEEAKQLLGVTDAFLGRKDTTATSGRAKELSIQQSSGRLESKRIMKNYAYAEIYELIIKFLIAFSDEERPLVFRDMDGQTVYASFSRYDFLEQDAAGQFYYNVDFLFSCDDSGALASNREAMWQETRLNFQQGAFGPADDLNTQILFWQLMEQQHYPNASQMKQNLERRKAQSEELQQLKAENTMLNARLSEQQTSAAAAQQALAERSMQDAEEAAALSGELFNSPAV